MKAHNNSLLRNLGLTNARIAFGLSLYYCYITCVSCKRYTVTHDTISSPEMIRDNINIQTMIWRKIIINDLGDEMQRANKSDVFQLID